MTRGNPNHVKWSEEDDAMLAEAHTRWPVEYPSSLLARHARHSCHVRAHRKGLTRGRNVGRLFDHVTPTQWAYFAGIIDGEGTIGRYGAGNRAISFVNTDVELIRWVCATFPGGGVSDRPARIEGHLDQWQVRWTRMAVIAELLEGLLPFLIVKKERAVKLLESFPGKFTALT